MTHPEVSKSLQEDEGLTLECRSLLPTLPTETGWVDTDLYLYCGFWLDPRSLNGLLSVQRNFQAHPSDILLVTHPKSGTTWLKALVFALLNRSKYTPNNNSVHPLLQTNPHDLVPFLEMNLYVEDKNPDLSCFAHPRLFATHLSFVSLPSSINSSGCRLVYLCRNPKDTLISFWHFTNKLRPKETGTVPIEEAFDKFCRGVCMYGPFWDHVLGYWRVSQEMPQRIMFLKYEELKEQLGEQLRRLSEFLGCPFSQEEVANGRVEEILRLCSFECLSSLEVNQSGKSSAGPENSSFFRRGEVGDWANHLTEEMIQRLDRVTQEKFHGSGLNL